MSSSFDGHRSEVEQLEDLKRSFVSCMQSKADHIKRLPSICKRQRGPT
jgi:hypothetical protein